MKIVVGLGNPGKRYEVTPHNVGFMVLDHLADRWSTTFRRSLRFKMQSCRADACGDQVLLVKPQTYMNLSGTAVGAIMRYRKLGVADLVVVMDDADLDFGRIRIRSRGGSGGHRGLASICDHLGSSEFARVRLGIGRGRRGELVDHVLSSFSDDDARVAGKMVERAADAVVGILEDGVDSAMNAFNGREPEGTPPADG